MNSPNQFPALDEEPFRKAHHRYKKHILKIKVNPISPYSVSTPVKNTTPKFSYIGKYTNQFKSGNNRVYDTRTYNSYTDKKNEISKNPSYSRNFNTINSDINNAPNHNAINKHELLYPNPSTPSINRKLTYTKPPETNPDTTCIIN